MVNYATTPDATNLAGSRSAVGSGSALQKRTPVAQATTSTLNSRATRFKTLLTYTQLC